MNGDVKCDLSTLSFYNREQIEDFHRMILILQQKIIFSGETASPTRIFFQCMEEWSKIDKPKEFIAPIMTYITILLDNTG